MMTDTEAALRWQLVTLGVYVALIGGPRPIHYEVRRRLQWLIADAQKGRTTP